MTEPSAYPVDADLFVDPPWLTEAIEVGFQAMDAVISDDQRTEAGLAIRAALPIIERGVREQITKEIEDESWNHEPTHDGNGRPLTAGEINAWNDGIDAAVNRVRRNSSGTDQRISIDELSSRWNAVMEAHTWDWTTCALVQMAKAVGVKVTGVECVNGENCCAVQS